MTFAPLHYKQHTETHEENANSLQYGLIALFVVCLDTTKLESNNNKLFNVTTMSSLCVIVQVYRCNTYVCSLNLDFVPADCD